MADVTNQQILDKLNNDDITNKQLFSSLGEVLHTITDNMATKKDLERFATKEDLKTVKDELKTTKDELKADIKLTAVKLERKIRSSHTANIHHHLETRRAIGDLNRQLADSR